MSTRAANGSRYGSRSRKASGTNERSDLKSTFSKPPRSAQSSNSEMISLASQQLAIPSVFQQYTPPERLVNYTNGTAYSNTGYSSTYTNAVAYASGLPEELEPWTEIEQAIVGESLARALQYIESYDRVMEKDQPQKPK